MIDKSRLPSRHVSLGAKSSPHRSYYYAMGLSEKEINQPFVGVATCWNESAPCNISLSRQAQATKKGVKDVKEHLENLPLLQLRTELLWDMKE